MGCSSNAIWAIEFQNSNIQIRGLRRAEDFSPTATALGTKGLDGQRPKFLKYEEFFSLKIINFQSNWHIYANIF